MANSNTAVSNVIPFEFEARQVRTTLIDGQPWFCAADICGVLGYANSRQAVQKNCRAEGVSVRDTLTRGGKQSLTFISEGSLYRLILKSRKEEALRFEDWVCDEVLPAIRNHGRFEDEHRQMQTLIDETIGTVGFHMLGSLIKGKVSSLPATMQRKASAKIWSQTHAAFGVRSAADIPANQLDAARNFIAAYALEGEWLPKTQEGANVLTDMQLYDVYFVCNHFDHLHEIFKRHSLYKHLTGLGSRAGVEMIDHFHDGFMGTYKLKKSLGSEFEAVQKRLGLNQYSSR